MSVERARKALRGEKTDCVPLYDIPNHRGFMIEQIGIDPFDHAEEAISAAVKLVDVDLLVSRIPERLGSPDAAHLYGLAPTVWRNQGYGMADMYAYDPQLLRKLDFSVDVRKFQRELERNRKLIGDTALCTGFTYTTCIHYAAEDLNWENFLAACCLEEDSVRDMLDKFQAASIKLLEAWAATDIEVMFCHDDIATSTSTVQSPDWLRRNLIPRYKEIFKPIKDKGIPIMFATDGNFLSVAKDIASQGADGFFLDTPCISLDALVKECGPDMIYYTGPSPAVMTVGSPEDVDREVRELAEYARDLPRFFFHMPGGFTQNMPTENVISFYEAVKKYGQRG